MNDISATQLTLGIGGTITVGALISMMVQTVKLLIPGLHGTLARIFVLLACLVGTLVGFTLTTNTDWSKGATYAQAFVVWIGLFIATAGHYALWFKDKPEPAPVYGEGA